MAPNRSVIDQLCEQYRVARAEIDRLPGLEREVGLASLRLEAARTLQQVATTGNGMDWKPLSELVSHLVGGEGVERAVQLLDARAKKMAQATLGQVVGAVVAGKVALGAGAIFVLLVLGKASGLLTSAGQSVGAGLLAGTGVVVIAVIRGVQFGVPALGQAAQGTWGWAESLGTASDRVLTPARAVQAEVWAAAGGRPAPAQVFTGRARARAQLLVGLLTGVAMVCGLIFGYGVLQGLGLV